MNPAELLEVALYFAFLVMIVPILGTYIVRVYDGRLGFLRPVENMIYRLAGIDPGSEMSWQKYILAVLAINLIGFFVVYLLLRLQGILPFNPQGLGGVSPALAFNTAVSFATNTNWQSYSGETTMSYLSQMLGLTVQNFLSAATGMAVLAALIRGIVREKTKTIGNFYIDLTRSTLYVLLPLALLLALLLVSQGTVQTISAYAEAQPLEPLDGGASQTLALGPAAGQIAIKQLGTNGGGFFNVNSAHPFENPTPLTNFLEVLAILAIPAALTYTYGKMVGDTRQGWAIFIAMTIVFAALLGLGLWAEHAGNPQLNQFGVDQPLGNMEGKEVRFGVNASVLWSTATTAASNGSVNSMHASYTPLGSLGPMWLMQLGEIIYGGVGSGLYGMVAFLIVAVFVAGLMVGRTPEYLGKKIETFEMKMASLMILIPVLCVLVGTAIAVALPQGQSSILNPGPRGFSEVLYAFSSAGNNNGSAYAGLNANTNFYNIALGIAMLISRYWLIVPIVAIAGSLAAKKKVPASAGTLPSHTPLFIAWLIGVIIIDGALSFFPALALGPIVEALM